ncbi:MAG: biotin/lipoyl-containing protein [Gemmatimonadales bacterium]
MKYAVRVGAKTFEVTVEGSRVTVDGEVLEAHLAAVPGTPLHHLLLAAGGGGRGGGGESWTVAAEPVDGPGRWVLGALGERLEVAVVDERTRRIQALTGGRAGPTGGGIVTAPMPGLVIRVEVSAGQRVEAGTGLVVVEAMKMENELRAPTAGVVEQVHVVVGQAVERGSPLVSFERPKEAEPSG